jgi:hypothetical protein
MGWGKLCVSVEGSQRGAETPGFGFAGPAGGLEGLVAVDFQDFAVGIDFDLALAAVRCAVEFIDLAAVIGIAVIRGHGEAGDLGLGGGEDVGRDGAGLRGAGCASAAGCAGGAGSTLIRGAACSAILRGSAGGEQGGGGDEEQGFQCFHSLVGFSVVGCWEESFKFSAKWTKEDSRPANDANPREWSREKSSADSAECTDFESGMLKTEI